MRWLPLVALFLCAAAPISTSHDSQDKVDAEFFAIYKDAQMKQFEAKQSTPNLADLQDKQIVIVSSNGWSTVMWRDNQEVYALRGSCVTVRR